MITSKTLWDGWSLSWASATHLFTYFVTQYPKIQVHTDVQAVTLLNSTPHSRQTLQWMKTMDDPGETWVHVLPSEWNWQHPGSVSSSTCQGWVGDIQVFPFVPSFQAVKSMFTNALRLCPCRSPENHVLGLSGFLTTQQATGRDHRKGLVGPFHPSALGREDPVFWETIHLLYNVPVSWFFYTVFVPGGIPVWSLNEWQLAGISITLPCLLEKQTQ